MSCRRSERPPRGARSSNARLQLDADRRLRAEQSLLHLGDSRASARRRSPRASGRSPFSPICEPARNNLALAYAVGGSLDDSERAFASGGERPAPHYNMGMRLPRPTPARRRAESLRSRAAPSDPNSAPRPRWRGRRVATGEPEQPSHDDARCWRTTPADAADRTAALVPPTPRTLGKPGMSLDLVVQLVLKLLHFSGELTGIEMSRRLGLEFSSRRAGARRFSSACTSAKSSAARRSAGRRTGIASPTRAASARMLFLENNQYVGVAPVPLAQYVAYLRRIGSRAAVDHARRACATRSRTWC